MAATRGWRLQRLRARRELTRTARARPSAEAVGSVHDAAHVLSRHDLNGAAAGGAGQGADAPAGPACQAQRDGVGGTARCQAWGLLQLLQPFARCQREVRAQQRASCVRERCKARGTTRTWASVRGNRGRAGDASGDGGDGLCACAGGCRAESMPRQPGARNRVPAFEVTLKCSLERGACARSALRVTGAMLWKCAVCHRADLP